MTALKDNLRKILKGAHKIVVVGVGNALRSDDSFGLLAAKLLLKKGPKKEKVEILLGESAPENLTGSIRKLKPTHVIFIDCAEMNLPAGSVKIIDPATIGGVSASTHNLPLGLLLHYLEEEIKCKCFILGIQPKSTAFGEKMSPELRKALEAVVEGVASVLC